MIDLRITSNGDFDLESTGDLMLTGTDNQSSEEIAVAVSQLSYMAIKTNRGDYILHGNIGNELSKIIGLPNKPVTSSAGIGLIKDAIAGWGVNYPITIEAWPESQNSIGYEVNIKVGSPARWVKMTLNQILDDAGLEV